jgi:hypothetical protein
MPFGSAHNENPQIDASQTVDGRPKQKRSRIHEMDESPLMIEQLRLSIGQTADPVTLVAQALRGKIRPWISSACTL